jgi:predicted small lipoprotein YifL
MKTGFAGLGFAAILLAGCGQKGPTMAPDTQTFTRNVNATPSQVVEATTSVFAARGISVASADRTKGKVESVPLSLSAEWGNTPASERADCQGVTAADPNARLVLTMNVRRDNDRSAFSLGAKRDGGESCVLQGPFLNGLMDDIVAKTGT